MTVNCRSCGVERPITDFYVTDRSGRRKVRCRFCTHGIKPERPKWAPQRGPIPGTHRPPRQLADNPDIPGTVLVPLTQGKFAIVDEADAAYAGQFSWHASRRDTLWYAVRCIRRRPRRGEPRMEYLHRSVGLRSGLDLSNGIDHKNHDGLDCRRSNLRAATSTQNSANARTKPPTRSRFRGVWPSSREGRWAAVIGSGETRRYIGTFSSDTNAALAYNAAAIAKWGEFATLNVVPEVAR